MSKNKHLSETSLREQYAAFLDECPDYAATLPLDTIRATEFSRLDRLGHVYLDYTGGGLYAESQIRDQMSFLLGTVLGNPHSSNPTSSTSDELVERCRSRILRFFNAPEDEYVAIFTGNASQAIKLVGEAYPFSSKSHLLLTFDNHNSANGLREYARAGGTETCYLPIVPPDLRIAEGSIQACMCQREGQGSKLFVYPVQSNFSGVQHPLEWVEHAHQRGWDVILDAAAYVPTNRLDIARWRPEFVPVSFYKMFGYPTGVGALIARRDALEKLRRPWFAGGTITVASVQADQHFLHVGPAGFEDGTLNYACLPAIERGLDFLDSVGMETVHDRVSCLTGWLLNRMTALEHGNAALLVRIYGPTSNESRGGTIAFNVYDRDGHAVDHLEVERRANTWNISLRTGCFCNPGAGEMALGLTKDEIVTCFTQADSRMTFNEFRRCIDEKSTGAVRISLGVASNFADAAAFIQFLKSFREA